jgi:hypothetical protein
MKSNLIEVDKKIKPLPFNKRTIPELIIGGDYYVCFGDNKVRPCKLLEIRENGIVVVDKNPPIIFKTARRGEKLVINCSILYKDEIGLTPIHAVHNMVG